MIEFRHIDKTYEVSHTEVFRDFSAHIFPGEFVFITGESGSGKSTLIRMLLKEENPDSGQIFVADRDISKIDKEKIPYYRRDIGVIFQDFRLIRDMDAYENIELARLAVGGSRKDSPTRIGNIMKMLRISDLRKRKPAEMSGGEQQKVCLARAIVNHPKIFLADEPTANLDPEYTEEMLRLFELIHAQGTTVVIATQDPILKAYDKARQIELTPSIYKENTEALMSGEYTDIFERMEDRVSDYIERKEQERMEKKAASEVEGLQTDELRLMASDETLYQVLDSLRDYLRKCGSTEELTTSILIAAEEIYVNIAHYAYGGKPGEAVVQIEVEPTPGKCRVVFRDRGMPYNPLEKEDPDITLSAEERSIGGLGIFMVKESMDYVDYRYENGENILTIEKSI